MKIFALLVTIVFSGMLLGGCDEEMDMMKPVMEDHAAPDPEEPTKPEPPKEKPPVDSGMMGEVKKPEEPVTPDPEPEPPEELPMVTKVTHYANQQLTNELTDTIEEGTTIYTKVVFSKPMQHIVSDGEDARPVISFLINDTVTRYRVKPHGASGKDYITGDCKPRGNSTVKFICKYTAQAEDDGVFAVQIGNASADKDGNTLAADYLSDITLTLMPTEMPEIIEEPDPIEQLPEMEEPKQPDPLLEMEEPISTVFVANPEIAPPEHVRRATPLPGITADDLAVRDIQTILKLAPEAVRMEPVPETALGKAADKISLLPMHERQQAYNNFVVLVDLPHFIEASNIMIERSNQLAQFAADNDEGFTAYSNFFDELLEEFTGLRYSQVGGYLDQSYYEENPDDILYPDNHSSNQGNSHYWILLEYVRLSLQYPGAHQQDLFKHYRNSVKNGWIFGLDNPWV